MSIIGTVVNFILILATLIATAWTVVGIPTAIIVAIVRTSRKNEEQKKKDEKIIRWALAGIPILVGCFILFFIASMLLSFFGLTTTNLSLPPISAK